jgi:hypothetical protein
MEEAAAKHALQLQVKDSGMCEVNAAAGQAASALTLCNTSLCQLMCEVEAQKLRVEQLDLERTTIDMQRQQAEQQLIETRSSVEEQQQQLKATIDLQGRTHARLMQLTSQHDQVTSLRRIALNVQLKPVPPQLTADHGKVSQALRTLAAASAAAESETRRREEEHAASRQLLLVRSTVFDCAAAVSDSCCRVKLIG